MLIRSCGLRVFGRERLHFLCVRQTSLYVQGQSPGPEQREYFYYVDHQGQLFLDDTKLKNFITCFKVRQSLSRVGLGLRSYDVGFLSFFFRQLKLNRTERYSQDFPYISPCGPELNYIRCDDQPIVFTHHLDTDVVMATRERRRQDTSHGYLSYGGTGHRLVIPFQPSKLCMLPSTGRVYHPAPEKVGGIGLVKSSLAIEISKNFRYPSGSEETTPPTHFVWQGESYLLDNELLN